MSIVKSKRLIAISLLLALLALSGIFSNVSTWSSKGLALASIGIFNNFLGLVTAFLIVMRQQSAKFWLIATFAAPIIFTFVLWRLTMAQAPFWSWAAMACFFVLIFGFFWTVMMTKKDELDQSFFGASSNA